jgi:hypothetical protein
MPNFLKRIIALDLHRFSAKTEPMKAASEPTEEVYFTGPSIYTLAPVVVGKPTARVHRPRATRTEAARGGRRG